MAGLPVVQRSCKGLNRTSAASICLQVLQSSPRHTATLASDVLGAICHADAARFRWCSAPPRKRWENSALRARPGWPWPLGSAVAEIASAVTRAGHTGISARPGPSWARGCGKEQALVTQLARCPGSTVNRLPVQEDLAEPSRKPGKRTRCRESQGRRSRIGASV